VKNWKSSKEIGKTVKRLKIIEGLKTIIEL